MNLTEEETCSASNGSIDEEKEGNDGLSIIDRKYEEEDEVPKPLSIMEKGHDSLICSSDQGK